ncbi:hypothetical protein [Rhizobium sp. Rhizsp42]|uniref:hypothetical protein n=1 Tax=Rhizobium sp. Rhizsp42 TaxID=3243034 RepID=UPI0039B09CAB
MPLHQVPGSGVALRRLETDVDASPIADQANIVSLVWLGVIDRDIRNQCFGLRALLQVKATRSAR